MHDRTIMHTLGALLNVPGYPFRVPASISHTGGTASRTGTGVAFAYRALNGRLPPGSRPILDLELFTSGVGF